MRSAATALAAEQSFHQHQRLIVLGKRSISADTALRLARAFGASEGFWMNLQADYDLEQARAALAKQFDEIERLAA